MNDHCGLVGPFAAMRMRREIGRIGLDEQTMIGNLGCHRAELVRLFEREHSRKADVQAERKELFGLPLIAGERMHHAAEFTPPASLLQHGENFGGRLAQVNH